jgi:CDP-diacylglycerol---glycerol-3-phosphate 3-phosphatidyltransferase
LILINVPNSITGFRVVLALFTVALLWIEDDVFRWSAFVLTILVIYGDALDGYFARKLNQASKFGSVLDIAGDRIVEMTYWIAFCALSWVQVWVPLLFLVRGTLVDVVRAHFAESGFTAFGERTMMKTGLGKFLVASNFSRFSYAVAKVLAFTLLVASHTTAGNIPIVRETADFFVYFACVFCVLRGLPVLMESGKLFLKSDA